MSEIKSRQQGIGRVLRVVAPRLAVLTGQQQQQGGRSVETQLLPRIQNQQPLPRLAAVSDLSAPAGGAETDEAVPDGGGEDTEDGPTRADLQQLRERVEDLESKHEQPDPGSPF